MNDILFENEVALVLIVKNESRYIGEWLEYHYRIGVDKFYIYDNDSDDRIELLKVLEPWILAKIVEFETVTGVRRQMPVYNDAIEKYRFNCRYMGFIDTDEFIYLKNGQNLREFLNEYFDTKLGVAGLGINWRMFGSSGKEFYEPIDVIERFTHRASDKDGVNNQIKTIVNPRLITYFATPHHAEYYMGCGCFDEHANLIMDYKNEINTCDIIQCNHYFTKSREELMQKISRGRADIGVYRKFEEEENRNKEFNLVVDVGLRDFWRELKLQPLIFSKEYGSKKILTNIRQMLNPFLIRNVSSDVLVNQTEKFLTCFYLIRNSQLLTPEEKRTLEDLILELITRTAKETNIEICHLIMLLFSRDAILETKLDSAIELMRLLSTQIPKLIAIAENSVISYSRFLLQQIQKDLKLMLN